MNEILNSAKKLEQSSNQQTENIKNSVSKGFQQLETHLIKHIKQNAITTRNAIQEQNKQSQQAIETATFKALPVFLMGMVLGAALVVGVLFTLQKLNIQL